MAGMNENAIQQLIGRAFPFATKEEWIATAISEINDSEPFKKLSWRDADGLEFLPYYDKSANFNAGTFDLAPSSDENFSPRAWLNLPPVVVRDVTSANQRALDHLMNGADGIHFILRNDFSDVDALLQNIHPEHCLLSFGGEISPDATLHINQTLSRASARTTTGTRTHACDAASL